MSLLNLLPARDTDTDYDLANAFMFSGRAWGICGVLSAGTMIVFMLFHIRRNEILEFHSLGFFFASLFTLVFAVTSVAYLIRFNTAGDTLRDRHYSAVRKMALAKMKAAEEDETHPIDYQMAVDESFGELVAHLATSREAVNLVLAA